MSDEILKRDQNHITVLAGVTDDGSEDIKMLRVDPTTKRLLCSFDGTPGSGSVTSVSVVTANGISGSVANPTSTPAITIDPSGITTLDSLTSATALSWTGMADGTDGQIPTFNASGEPSFVSTGNSGQVLTSNGAGTAPTFQNASGAGWSLTGNSGTTAGTNFIGTTDDQDVVFKRNSLESFRVDFVDAGTNIIKFSSDAVQFADSTDSTFMQKTSGGSVSVINGSTQITVNSSTIQLSPTSYTEITDSKPVRFTGGSYYTELQKSASQDANLVLTLPINAGSNGQVLTTNGSGVLSFTTPSGGGGISTVSVTLTQSDMNNLHTTPITLLAAQGAGTVIVP